MRHFRVQDQGKSEGSELKLTFDQKLHSSLNPILRLLPFVDFTVNYGYAIENVWVTMLMITHGTPNMIDSFVWIVPIIIAILLRPYIVRYVHSINYRVYNQISVVSFCLFLGAFGCFLIGLSCQLDRKSQMFRRILECSVGWTLMDFGFQICQYFTEQIQNSYQELQRNETVDIKVNPEAQNIQRLNKKQNFQFYGLFLGYIVSLLICWVIHGKTVKQFYKCCKYAYWTVGGLALITAIRLKIQSQINLPKRQVMDDKQTQLKILAISGSLPYYLPGFYQLIKSSKRTLALLCLHFVIVFLNDMIMIYTTMWFTEPSGVKFKSHGDALITGLQYGTIALIIYTIVDNLKIKNKILCHNRVFMLSLIIIIIFCIFTFFRYSNFTFLIIAILVGAVNQLYRHTVYNHQSQNNVVFERCTEITQRFEKIFVLSIMPAIVLLILGRDDIQDVLIWSAGMALLGTVAFNISHRIDIQKQNEKMTVKQSVKVAKIQ